MTDSCLEKHLSINEKWSLFHMYSPTFKAVDLNDSIKILLRFYSLLCSSNPLYNLDIPAATDVQKGGREELPLTQGQRRPRVPGCDGTGAVERSYPMSEVRGGGREELPYVQGQGQRPRGATPRPRSGFMGAGGPRGATPPSRSAGATLRRYPSSKVRSIGCTLLEQP